MVSDSARQAQRFVELREPGLDEGLGLGVSVAASPVGDAESREVLSETAGCELSSVIGAERERPWRDLSLRDCRVDAGECFVGSASQLDVERDDFSGAAVNDGVQVDPTALSSPHQGPCPCATTRWDGSPERSRAVDDGPVRGQVAQTDADA